MEGPPTCPKVMQPQEHRLLSPCREGADHVTSCFSEGEEGRQTHLVTQSRGIWPRPVVGLVQPCSTVEAGCSCINLQTENPCEAEPHV